MVTSPRGHKKKSVCVCVCARAHTHIQANGFQVTAAPGTESLLPLGLDFFPFCSQVEEAPVNMVLSG